MECLLKRGDQHDCALYHYWIDLFNWFNCIVIRYEIDRFFLQQRKKLKNLYMALFLIVPISVIVVVIIAFVI